MKNIIRLGISVCFALMMSFSLSFAQSTKSTTSNKITNQKQVPLHIKEAIKAHKRQTAHSKAQLMEPTIQKSSTSSAMKRKSKVVQKTVQKNTLATPKKETPKKEE